MTNLLKEIGKTACKPVSSTPIDPNMKLGRAKEDVAVDREIYERLVGKLIYLSYIRPDISYAVSIINQFMHNLKEIQLQATYRVLQFLFKGNGGAILEAYTNADYAGLPIDRRSTNGYCTLEGIL